MRLEKLLTFDMLQLSIITLVLLAFTKLACESSNTKVSIIRVLSKVINIISKLLGSVILDIVIFEIFRVEDVILITVSIASISDMIESAKFTVDRNELNNDFC